MAKINTSNTFELISSNKSLREINDTLLDANSRLTNKNKDLLEINALQKDIITRLELTLQGLCVK